MYVKIAALSVLVFHHVSCDIFDEMREHTPHFLSSLFERDASQILNLQKNNLRPQLIEATSPRQAKHMFADMTNDKKMIELNKKAVEAAGSVIMGYKDTCMVSSVHGKSTEAMHDVYSIRNHTLAELKTKVFEMSEKQHLTHVTENMKGIEQVLSESKLLPRLRFEIMSIPQFMHVSDFTAIIQDLDCVEFVEEDSITSIASIVGLYPHIRMQTDTPIDKKAYKQTNNDSDKPVQDALREFTADKMYFKYGEFGINYKSPAAYDVLAEKIVAVIDVGFSHHSDLDDAYYINPAENCPNFLDDDQNGYLDDCVGYNFLLGLPNPFFESIPHGTPVTGLISGKGDDKKDEVEGLCQKCKVMPLKAGSYGRFLRSAIAKAVEYSAQMEVPVVNASFGGKKESQIECESIRRSVKNKDSLFVIAAGNDGCDLDNECDFYPAECSSANLIVVGGSNATGHAAPWSNYGRHNVHVFAPGQDVYTTIPDDLYKQTSGTSFAAPIVSAIAGDIMSRYPKLNTQQVRDIILNSCRPVPHLQDKCQCGGIVDHNLALEKARKLAPSSQNDVFEDQQIDKPQPKLLDIHKFNILNRLFHLFD